MSETADQARTRRRWITLAEVVAVAGLVIAALGLWMNWHDRQADVAERTAEQAGAQQGRTIATLTGDVNSDGDTITLADQGRTISGATVQLPPALGIAAQDAMPGPRVEVGWFAHPLLQLTDRGTDDRAGRLPVLITTSWWDGATQRQDRAIYDILWRTRGRLIGGRKVVMTGLVLRSRTGTAAALAQAWEREKPRPPA